MSRHLAVERMQDPKLSTMDHLSTKSSVFHPTQLGAGGQQEIFRHMKRHYDRLGRVTAATDSSPPKSYKTSTLGMKYWINFRKINVDC